MAGLEKAQISKRARSSSKAKSPPKKVRINTNKFFGKAKMVRAKKFDVGEIIRTENVKLPEGVKALKRGFMADYFSHDGLVVVDYVAKGFRMSKGQVAETAGLPREAVYKKTRVAAEKTQSRMIEMLEIVNRVSGWAGGKEQAMAWYRAEPIPALGDRTAESLVKSGKAAVVRDYLDVIASGGFA